MSENNDNELDKIDDLPINVTVFGKVIGTASGWEEVENLSLIFLDFKPNELGDDWLSVLPEEAYKAIHENKTLFINFETGAMQYSLEEDIFVELTPNWSAFT